MNLVDFVLFDLNGAFEVLFSNMGSEVGAGRSLTVGAALRVRIPGVFLKPDTGVRVSRGCSS